LVLRKTPFFFQIEVVVVDIIFSQPTTTSNLTLPKESYSPKDYASQLEVVEQRKNACSTSTCVSLFLPKELPSIKEALKLLPSSQDAAVQSSVFCGAESINGNRWSVEVEKQFREMVQGHKRVSEIAGFFGKSCESIKQKNWSS